MGGGGWSCGVSANEYSCAHHVTWSANKLWRSTSIFNLCLWLHRSGYDGPGGSGSGPRPGCDCCPSGGRGTHRRYGKTGKVNIIVVLFGSFHPSPASRIGEKGSPPHYHYSSLSTYCLCIANNILKGDFFGFFLMYVIQHRFVCGPSDPLCRRMPGSNPGLLRHRQITSCLSTLASRGEVGGGGPK